MTEGETPLHTPEASRMDEATPTVETVDDESQGGNQTPEQATVPVQAAPTAGIWQGAGQLITSTGSSNTTCRLE